ncbi:MAG: HD domain-containing protein [Spirochaetales bacterium]|nr:HD domain-containing protein [Spirochaetales bacterium]
MTLTKAPNQRVRILIVDDDQNILDLYEKILRPGQIRRGSVERKYPYPDDDPHKDVEVCFCNNPPEAIHTVEESQPDPFSLAFLDVHLGSHEETGIRLAEKIRKLDEDIEIVFVTGDSGLDLSRIAADIPPKDKLFYLNKPFKALEIRQFTESLSNKWITERQLKEMQANLEHLVDERTRELSDANSRLRGEIAERRRLEENLVQSLERNQVVIKGTIQLIARFLEMKDPYTASHQKRVSELAVKIAEALGLNEHDREGINMAALIHDIGKISIPSEILSKPGKLSDIEYDLIKTHSQKGYEILKEIEFPWPIAKIVLQHHEKLNGSGYPDGLRGDQILFPSRILTVADVMEAISSHRPYRASLGVDFGLEYIITNSGVLFDPVVVKECVSLFGDKKFQFQTPGLHTRA